jgi:hypothetical protein
MNLILFLLSTMNRLPAILSAIIQPCRMKAEALQLPAFPLPSFPAIIVLLPGFPVSRLSSNYCLASRPSRFLAFQQLLSCFPAFPFPGFPAIIVLLPGLPGFPAILNRES